MSDKAIGVRENISMYEEYHPIDSIMDEYGVEPFDTFDFKKKYVIKTKGNLIFIKLLNNYIILNCMKTCRAKYLVDYTSKVVLLKTEIIIR